MISPHTTTHEKLHFRPAQAEDTALLLSLIRDLAEFEKRLDQVSATEEMLRHNLFNQEGAPKAVIAEWDGKPVGFALYFYTFSTFLGRPGLYIEDIYVRPEVRSQGIGKAFFVHLARIANARGGGRMEWSVLHWNTRAIDFYKRLGAISVDEWAHYRLSGPALEALTAC